MALPAIVGTLLIPVLMQILKLVTPTLREELVKFLQEWTARCYATPNKWDDIAAKLVASILSVDLSGVIVKPTDNDVTNAVVGAFVTIATGTPPGWSAERPFDPSVDTGA
jgi:hypothetical protein